MIVGCHLDIVHYNSCNDKMKNFREYGEPLEYAVNFLLRQTTVESNHVQK